MLCKVVGEWRSAVFDGERPRRSVLDPSCGSGTTAYVAERWGRRWIAIDTSRVPLALTRQRLLTATYSYYELKDGQRGPASGFIYAPKQNKKGEEVGGIVPRACDGHELARLRASRYADRRRQCTRVQSGPA